MVRMETYRTIHAETIGAAPDQESNGAVRVYDTSQYCSRRAMTVARAVIAVTLLLVAGAVLGEEHQLGVALGDVAALDEAVTAFMAEHAVPGVLYARIVDGRLDLVRTHGLANVELAVPVSEDTVFEIGSISKQFVAAVVMLLVEEGRLGLEDPVERHVPDIPGEWFGVTVRQLLTHTSGIPDYEEIASYDVYQYRLTPEDVIRIAHSRPVDFAPGTGFYYSNTGYFLLSCMVERLEGKPLGAVLDARIFGPLGMTKTRMSNPEAIIPGRASGYWVNKTGQLINRAPTQTSSTLGAGGILTCARDMALWDKALSGEDFLSASSKETMWTPVQLPNGNRTSWPDGTPVDYGFGWKVTPYRGLRVQSHSGQVAGFIAHYARFPERNVAILVFLNRYQVNAEALFEKMIEALVPEVPPAPE